MVRTSLMVIVLMGLTASSAMGGPYAPAAEQSGSTAVYMTDGGIVAWATGYIDMIYGTEVVAQWKTPEKALGPAKGNSVDIVSLGRGGSIVMTFGNPIKNGLGWDFVVFENGIDDNFLELAYAEVSSNGTDFVRFANDSQTQYPVSAGGSVDPTDIDGFAGKYRKGYGTPFDLQKLADRDEVGQGTLDLTSVTHVRIIDIAGDGTAFDTDGDVIYDPYPTIESAGFDLEAVGVRYEKKADNSAPDPPQLSSPEDNAIEISLVPVLETRDFSDTDAIDNHLASRWQISIQSGFADGELMFDHITLIHLTTLTVPRLILDPNKAYFWRVAFLDSQNEVSNWSEIFQFTTVVDDER
ncbi:MAG: hypothetical protein GY866_35635, partial [Proteobacteria bacterium]|nr:hypothetical protein [Pseudomonadota bacterium]